MSRVVRPDGRCAGVDGCRRGWVVATRAGVELVASIGDVLAEDFDVVGIDMPIGLPDDGVRSCEPEARRFIAPRGSTIFPTPSRACLDALDYPHACELSRAVTGKAISKQAWHILPRIREVDTCAAAVDGERVIEVHPECSFAMMNGGVVMPSKHTRDGIAARTAAIERVFDIVPPRIAGAQRDDVLDAFAVLWSTERFARGMHRSFPSEGHEFDGRGRLMRIIV